MTWNWATGVFLGANFHYVLSSIARRFFYNAEVSILGKLSREGKVVPDIDVAFRFGTKLTMLGATNGFGWVKILNWSFLCSTSTKFYPQPPPPPAPTPDLGQFSFRVLFADWTDYLPTTEAFFAFQFNFIIIVFLHCRHEMKYNCCLLFFGFLKLNCLFRFSSRKASQRNGIHRWLRLWQFMQALTADNK